MLQSSVIFLLRLLETVEYARGLILPVKPVQRVCLLKGMLVDRCTCLTAYQGECGKILVCLEQEEELRLQRVGVAGVETEDCRPEMSVHPAYSHSYGLRTLVACLDGVCKVSAVDLGTE